jgi:hypothetical protein
VRLGFGQCQQPGSGGERKPPGLECQRPGPRWKCQCSRGWRKRERSRLNGHCQRSGPLRKCQRSRCDGDCQRSGPGGHRKRAGASSLGLGGALPVGVRLTGGDRAHRGGHSPH